MPKPVDRPCTDCKGLGFIWIKQKRYRCEICAGTGVLR